MEREPRLCRQLLSTVEFGPSVHVGYRNVEREPLTRRTSIGIQPTFQERPTSVVENKRSSADRQDADAQPWGTLHAHQHIDDALSLLGCTLRFTPGNYLVLLLPYNLRFNFASLFISDGVIQYESLLRLAHEEPPPTDKVRICDTPTKGNSDPRRSL